MLWASFFTALAVAVAVTFLLVKAGVGDVAVGRSSHQSVTATCGGVAFVAAIGSAIFIYLMLGGDSGFAISMPLMMLITVVAVTGLIDDIRVSASVPKFFIIALLAALSVMVIGPVDKLSIGASDISLPIWFGYIGGAIWIAAVMNLVNFMDGANGMQALTMGISFMGVLLFSVLMHGAGTNLLALAMIAAYLGFLPFNLKEKARIFSGDVGSLTAGYIYAISILILAKESENASAIYMGPLLILPTLTDTVLTVLRRAKSGENIFKAHNTHLYQIMLRIHKAHLPVGFGYAGATLLCVGIVFFAVEVEVIREPIFVIGMIVVAIIIYKVLYKRAKNLDVAPDIN